MYKTYIFPAALPATLPDFCNDFNEYTILGEYRINVYIDRGLEVLYLPRPGVLIEIIAKLAQNKLYIEKSPFGRHSVYFPRKATASLRIHFIH